MADRRTPSPSDEELLARLHNVMAPGALQPPPAAVHDVRLLLAGRSLPSRRPGPRLSGRRPLLSGWRARLGVAGATVGAVVVAGGTAFALGAPVPEPVRALAYDLGLPVTPPAVVQVQSAAQTVRSDLAPASGASRATTVRDTRALGSALRGLEPNELPSVRSSERVYARACRDLAAPSGMSAPPSNQRRQAQGCTSSGSVAPTPTPGNPARARGGSPGGGRGTPPGGRTAVTTTTPPGSRPTYPPGGSNRPRGAGSAPGSAQGSVEGAGGGSGQGTDRSRGRPRPS